MFIPYLVSKIQNAVVTGPNPEADGSIAIDVDVLKKAGLKEYQMVDVYNVSHNSRMRTYCSAAPAGSGQILLNSSADSKISDGDNIVIMAFAMLDERELDSRDALILFLTDKNVVKKVVSGKL